MTEARLLPLGPASMQSQRLRGRGLPGGGVSGTGAHPLKPAAPKHGIGGPRAHGKKLERGFRVRAEIVEVVDPERSVDVRHERIKNRGPASISKPNASGAQRTTRQTLLIEPPRYRHQHVNPVKAHPKSRSVSLAGPVPAR